MKYKLLKDTPTIKAGTIFEEIVNMSDGTRELTVAVPGEDVPQDPQFTIQDIDNFDEWFEKMEDSIHYQPRNGEKVFCLNEEGDIYSFTFNDLLSHHKRLAFGFVYHTLEEAQKTRERRLAEIRLQQTSDFKPDPYNGELGWIVGYSCRAKKLAVERFIYSYYGETIHYKTAEDAKKSIKENREDWLKYFGIEED